MAQKNESEYTVALTKDGVTETFGPGEDLPSWSSKKVTNPLVLGTGVEDDGAIKEHKPAAKKAPAKAAPKAEPKPEAKADSGS